MPITPLRTDDVIYDIEEYVRCYLMLFFWNNENARYFQVFVFVYGQKINRCDFFCNLCLFRLVNFLLYWECWGSLIDVSTTQSKVAMVYCISQGSSLQATKADSLIKKQSLLKGYWVTGHRVIVQARDPG